MVLTEPGVSVLEKRAAQSQGIYPYFVTKNRIKLADPASKELPLPYIYGAEILWNVRSWRNMYLINNIKCFFC